MSFSSSRRHTLRAVTLGLATGAVTALSGRTAGAASIQASLIPRGAKTLNELTDRLAKAPRRRDYKTLPMIVTSPDQWDHEALDEVIAYRGDRKQVWDNTELGGPWLNVMRNSLNAQIWSFGHKDFLCVSATHGLAHLALYDGAMWDKYQFAKLTDGKFKTNTLVSEPEGITGGTEAFQSPDGPFSSKDNRIATLQRRGVPFLACHNAVWEMSSRLVESGNNPDHLTVEQLNAELTNHLIPGVIATPGAVATLVELQRAGFTFAK